MNLAIIALLLILLLVILIVGGRMLCHRLIFKPDHPDQTPEPEFPEDVIFENIWMTTTDGHRLHGWYCNRADNKGVMLICHGNKGSIAGREDTVLFYLDLGINVFIFDYRGYGMSPGHPDETGTYNDVMAAWHYLHHERAIPASEIALLGRSLGAAIAAHLAVEEQPGAVLLESTFSSLPHLAAELYPLLKALFRLNVRYDTSEKIAHITSPLLLVHSTEDELIGMHHAEKLLSNAPSGTQFLQILGRHRDGFALSREIYIPAVVAFLNDHGFHTHVPRLTTSQRVA